MQKLYLWHLPRSRIHRRYELATEKVTQARSGPKRCTVALREAGRLDAIVITTNMPTAQGQMHLVETRQLLDKGHVHAQVR